ncbi:type I-G CRISPR-associated RAMP protein Csb1/Cas7g [Rhodothermus marinus]|jgi:CRISPR-associated protein Csb1|uniref:Type I-U CRISPR-associated protein Cas7 n=1 Tax=Rhodothermus marinus (strain ATCC 43812 / DSM 4252 / R-10) TaxID=518766 RepID=D0MKL4_RHOM4|nr:type I-U CRISPR-associated RAMP protein Csb1/Cas7u [Rhodothermus marinus]ACY49678.1 conserved hypothetical protein [Rhodothermus marinus DSM 4252]
MDYDKLKRAVAGEASAIRAITRLQPADGPGAKIFPPTYEQGRYCIEQRWVDGESVTCVLLDSVQSQANRMETALLDARRSGRLSFPDIEVVFPANLDLPFERISVLEAPHRIADAILRDSNLNGTPFRDSEVGQQFVRATARNARGVLEISPVSLLFGYWDSTGLGTGGLGAKFARLIASEIVGYYVEVGQRGAVRVDPLGIQRGIILYEKGEFPYWTPSPENAVTDDKGNPKKVARRSGDKKEAGRPSVINHGNILAGIEAGGVSIRYALQNSVINFAALRQLYFGDPDPDSEVNQVARTYLAALALCALTALWERGYTLRSRCLLQPESRNVELLPLHPGKPEPIERLNFEQARKLFDEARDEAIRHGFDVDGKLIELHPCNELQDLIRENLQRINPLLGPEEEDAES